MPCVCERCLENAKTLGFAPKAPTKVVVRRAYRVAAKQWHPDRFDRFPAKRAEAEERFKHIQVAYRELWEHCETPVKLVPDRATAEPADAEGGLVDDRVAARKVDEGSVLSFGGAPYCFVPPHFSPYASEIIVTTRLEGSEKVVAFVDLSAGVSGGRAQGEYILLTSYRVFVRDALHIVSFVWFTDLGEVLLVDRNKHGKPRIWNWIVDLFPAINPRFSLLIYRRNRTLLYSLAGGADDRVKRVIYNFLLQKKSQART
ncbi:MAG TPA: J domain-containing protein [Terracidiphilus sp.]|nr:J domain-containing protein [Terracidiphilus sp.]